MATALPGPRWPPAVTTRSSRWWQGILPLRTHTHTTPGTRLACVCSLVAAISKISHISVFAVASNLSLEKASLLVSPDVVVADLTHIVEAKLLDGDSSWRWTCWSHPAQSESARGAEGAQPIELIASFRAKGCGSYVSSSFLTCSWVIWKLCARFIDAMSKVSDGGHAQSLRAFNADAAPQHPQEIGKGTAW